MMQKCRVLVWTLLLFWGVGEAYASPKVEQLTTKGVNGEAYYSPDGSKLIYQSYGRKAHAHTQIYILDLKTQKERRVSHHMGDDTCSYFHPTKKGLILFASTYQEVKESHRFKKFHPLEMARRKAARAKARKGKKWNMKRRRRRYQWIYKPYEVYSFNEKGKMLQRLTHAPGYDAEGTYSPDGTKVIFSSRRDGDQELYLMNADGTNQRRLTWRRGNDGGAFISPDNKQVTWRSFDFRGNAQVLVADLIKGQLKNIRQITHGKGIHWAPFWHPTGKWIVFSSNHETSYNNRRNFDIYLIDTAGTCTIKLTTHKAADVLPVFSPDGKWLAFTSKRVGGKSQIYRVPFSLPKDRRACVDPKKDYKVSGVLRFVQSTKKAKAGHKHSYRHYRKYRHYRRYRHYKRHAKRHGHAKHKHKAHKGHYGHYRHYGHKAHKGHHKGDHQHAASKPTTRPVTSRKPRFLKGELARDVHFLSHPLLEGRDAGTKGIKLAARYIATRFRSLGLKPGGTKGTFFQPFMATTGVKLGHKNSLQIPSHQSTFQVKKDFVPFGFSLSGAYKGKVVFAGYGVSDPASGYDDYKGIDVKGKAVLLLRYVPRWRLRGKHPFGRRKNMYAAFRYKLLNARTHGASAVILVDPPDAKEKQAPRLVPIRLSGGLSDAGILALHAKRSIGAGLLQGTKHKLKALVAAIDKDMKPRSVVLSSTIQLQIDLQRQQARIENVVGILKGSDPTLSKEYVVVGAHYDHLGYGHVGAFPGNRGKIHPGADDNASGTAVMMALARYFHQHPPKRSMIFIGFSGEERGLLGSAYFVQHPPVALKQMVTMLNFDMVGQMRNKRLVVQGSMTSPRFVPLLKMQSRGIGLNVKLGPSGYGPSDHTSFYARKIPVLFFFTGAHSRYHRPDDTFESINFKGMKLITHYAAKVTERITALPQRPAYKRVLSPLPRRKARGGMNAYLGSIPDYGSQIKKGVKLTGVRKDGPADKGGIKGGDILLKIGRFSLMNLYDMVFALRYYRPGDKVKVRVLRKGKELDLNVTLGQRRSYRR